MTMTIAECDFDGCIRPKSSVGLCTTHYQQKRRGKTLTPIRVKKSRELSTPDVTFWESIPLVTDVESDGALTIVSVVFPGFEDTHRRYAESHFDNTVVCQLTHEYVNRFDEPRVMTVWNESE